MSTMANSTATPMPHQMASVVRRAIGATAEASCIQVFIQSVRIEIDLQKQLPLACDGFVTPVSCDLRLSVTRLRYASVIQSTANVW